MFKPLKREAKLPALATAGSAGYDLAAAETATIAPGRWLAVGCGFAMEMPQGYEAQLRPRSGLALRFGVTLLNSPATIDRDYRGEVKVLLINHSRRQFKVDLGMRIAQMVFAPACSAVFKEVEELSASERGEGGFGHSGS